MAGAEEPHCVLAFGVHVFPASRIEHLLDVGAISISYRHHHKRIAPTWHIGERLHPMPLERIGVALHAAHEEPFDGATLIHQRFKHIARDDARSIDVNRIRRLNRRLGQRSKHPMMQMRLLRLGEYNLDCKESHKVTM